MRELRLRCMCVGHEVDCRQLVPLLQELEPLCLGLYWPLDGEFDAPGLLPPLPGCSPLLLLPLPSLQLQRIRLAAP